MLRRRKRVYLDDLPKTHDIRFALVFLVGLVVVLGAVYLVGHVVTDDKLAPGTTVAGADIGGLHRAEATTKLDGVLGPRLSQPITLTYRGRAFPIDPVTAGFRFDIGATLDDAMQGTGWDPRHMVHVLLGGGGVMPVVTVDRTQLDRALESIAQAVRVSPSNGGVTFVAGQPAATGSRIGAALDVAATSRRIQEALVRGSSHAALAVRSVDPLVGPAEVTHFIDKVATPAVAAPVTLHVRGQTIVVQPHQFAPALRARVHRDGLRLVVNPRVLYVHTARLLKRLPHQAANAGFAFRGGRPVVTPSRAGTVVTRPDWAQAVLTAVGRNGSHRHADVTVQRATPTFTTAQARRLRVKEQVASATTTVGTHVDAAQMRAAVSALDGTLLRPGERFSFNETIPTTDRQAATAVASTLYDAALSAGMQDIVSSPNRHYVAEFRPGFDAAVVPPLVDLSFRNTTPYGVYLTANVSGHGSRQAVRVALWSTRYWAVQISRSARQHVVLPGVRRLSGARCRPHAGTAGFDVVVSRRLARHGRTVHRDSRYSHYAARPAVVCAG